jgi:hypothetical protein
MVSLRVEQLSKTNVFVISDVQTKKHACLKTCEQNTVLRTQTSHVCYTPPKTPVLLDLIILIIFDEQ